MATVEVKGFRNTLLSQFTFCLIRSLIRLAEFADKVLQIGRRLQISYDVEVMIRLSICLLRCARLLYEGHRIPVHEIPMIRLFVVHKFNSHNEGKQIAIKILILEQDLVI